MAMPVPDGNGPWPASAMRIHSVAAHVFESDPDALPALSLHLPYIPENERYIFYLYRVRTIRPTLVDARNLRKVSFASSRG